MTTALLLISSFALLVLLYSVLGDRSVCYEDLGCFETGSPFYHYLYRPISVLPQDPLKLSIVYNLYTRKNPAREQAIRSKDDRALKKSYFNPNKPTKFITHGFRDGAKSHWMKTMKTALLTVEDANVFTIDWSIGAVPPYNQAASNTRVVGAEIARFIRELEVKYGLNRDTVHLIGHSLGAHICGYAGERLNGTLARITALDAAEPYFQNLPELVRLDPGDAKFVDAVHTDGRSIALLGFGMIQPVGHVDFYPDSGHSLKSCDVPNHISAMAREGILEGIFSATACNHRRAQDLFTESITTQCPFVAHACSEYESFEAGLCASCGENDADCARLGYHADTYTDKQNAINKKFYLTTNHRPPAFCMYHYVVTVNIANITEQIKETGILYANLHGDNYIMPAVELNKEEMAFEPGETYPFLVASDKDLGEVESMDFMWANKANTWMSGRQPKLYIKDITVEPIDVLPEITREEMARRTCSVEGPNKPIVAGQEAMFASDACQSGDQPINDGSDDLAETENMDNPTKEENAETLEDEVEIQGNEIDGDAENEENPTNELEMEESNDLKDIFTVM